MNGPNDADASEMAECEPQNKQNVFEFMRGLISRSSYQKCSDMKRRKAMKPASWEMERGIGLAILMTKQWAGHV